MLERLVAWVLNKYLGKYVENLNTDQLSIALLQGSVELENLPLKKDAFRHFGLPVNIKYGLIGKIKLKVPVTQLRSAPWIIVVEHLTVVLTPLSLNEWDEEAEEVAAHEYKLGLLDSLEASWRAQNFDSSQENSYYASSYYSWFSYSSGLITNIVENIQLEIKNVHIRYEDNVTTEHSFCMGVTIDSLSVESCDEQWCPGFKCWSLTDKYSFQLMQLSGLSIYFDRLPASEFWDTDNLDLSVVAEESHNYILPPVCAEARVKRNRSAVPLRSRTQPRIICDLLLQTVSISLSDIQHNLLIRCSKGLKRIQKCRKYIRFRPSVSVKEDPKAWWMYFVNCYQYESRGSIEKYISWEQCLRRAKENIAYVKLYTELLSSAAGPSITNPELKELKNQVEWERGFEELRVLREAAMFRTKALDPSVKKNLSNTGRSTLFQWFPQWWGWYSSPENAEELKTCPSTEESKLDSQLESLEDEILDVIADTVENNTILRRDTVFGQFNFALKDGNFRLCSQVTSDENCKCVMELLFNNVRLELESRPRSSSSRVFISLGSVILNDYLTENSIFPVLISPQNSEEAPSGKVNRNLPPTIAKLLSQTTGSTSSSSNKSTEPLFQLVYEYKPFTSLCDYKLHIKSQSLDIVYNADAVKWLLDFFVKPHQKSDLELKKAAKMRYYSMKQKTKEEFLKNWDNILQGHEVNRKQWDIKLDISAPQIFLVEHFTDRNTIICIIDFGKLYFTNSQELASPPSASVNAPVTQNSTELDITEDDDDAFATPCSTPPGSEISESSNSRRISTEEISKNVTNSINESNFHNKIYESYKIEFNELQVLLGRMKDNWKFAHLKGTSSMHVLDKFNIALQVERRVIYTTDPQYPALMILGNLPKLIVHANEQKVQAMRSVYDTVVGYWAQTPFRTPDAMTDEFLNEMDVEFAAKTQLDNSTLEPNNDSADSKLFMIQFIVDHLALEVQSRGRSIAELQVAGVKALFTRRPADTSLSLSVHSLLLVDALQTFGPDFELLLASHKHVGMDSMSGSLKDSDPTSPVSPGSPDPNLVKHKITTPSSLLQALSSLNAREDSLSDSVPLKCVPSSPLGDGLSSATNLHTFSDSEALILVDIVFIKDRSEADSELNEDVQMASIQFNNLDVVANQETIVELISFTRRVMSQFEFNQKYSQLDLSGKFSSSGSQFTSSSPVDDEGLRNSSQNETLKNPLTLTKTDLTFDFHRLNILLLRSVTLDSGMAVARKIATATMTNAKIHATVDDNLSVEGSLGGLQVLDLTNEGHVHQRIFSVGQDPLRAERCILSREKRPSAMFEHLSADIYNMRSKVPADKAFDNVQALNFTVEKSLTNKLSDYDHDVALVKVRFSSALYTHAPHFVAELSTYATEFKQYLKNIARSIGSAATEMALNLVHARAEALAQSLSTGHRQSIYGSASELQFSTPRKQWIRSPSVDFPTEVNTSLNTLSPADNEPYPVKIKLDVVIDSPIIILPRYATCYEVLVAHLGRISVNNEDSDEVTGDHGSLWTVKDRYNVEIRDMNLYSLNIENRIKLFTFKGDCIPLADECPPSMKAEDIYDCSSEGKPILHDTVIQLCVERDLKMNGRYATFLDQSNKADEHTENTKIRGRISTPLKFSLTRQQYELLIETVDNILDTSDKESAAMKENAFADSMSRSSLLPNIAEESELRSSVSALDLDPALRARMLQRHSSPNLRRNLIQDAPVTIYNVDFEVPVFTVELKADFGSGERGLVELSFRDFVMQYERRNRFETAIEMSLQSLVMEDLQREPNSKHRFMMVSSVNAAEQQVNVDFISTSCPDVSASYSSDVSSQMSKMPSSLPDYLETETVFGGFVKRPRLYADDRRDPCSKSSHHQRAKSNDEYPCTPPPSPRERRPSNMYSEENLVHISVVLYSKDSEQFFSKKLYRTVNVDFNSLNMIVNVQSWIVVLDFFGLSDDQPVSAQPTNYSKPVSRKQSVTSSFSPMNGIETHCLQRSEFDISIKSLSLILNRVEYELAKANISMFNAHIVRDSNAPVIGDITTMEGHIGTMSLHDMTPVHGKLYHERFITSGLDFYIKRYSKPDRLFTRDYDIDLKLTLPSVTYTHTQRFAFDLQTYYKHFTQLQKIFNSIRSASKSCDDWDLPTRVRLDISAASPVIIIPVSSQHKDVLIIDLGNLLITNTFKWSDSMEHDSSDETQICLLDVREVNLVNMDLFIGEWQPSVRGEKKTSDKHDCLYLGSYSIGKRSASLLQEKCKLKLLVEKNLSEHIHKAVPDMSYTGVLSTLAVTVDFAQYSLLYGLLMFNVGECLDDLFAQDEDMANTFNQTWDTSGDFVWRTNCLRLDLVNVSVTLLSSDAALSDDSLACVNFIKSHLSVESFSNKSQDVDLVSQEILITDTRFRKLPMNKRSNIFTNILQPIGGVNSNDNVRVEVHHRKREDKSHFTILLNSMRLMAILDWWEMVRDFVIDVNFDAHGVQNRTYVKREKNPMYLQGASPFEIKLNIIDSEVVVLEDTTQWDSNAVIFKSTTVINYKPLQPDKILSCNFNHCELFSCILGMEDETALSIVDPVTINCELSTRTNASGELAKVLQISSQQLCLRLSYNDVRMFMQILKSLPKQTVWARNNDIAEEEAEMPVNMRSPVNKLKNLGFASKDCLKALEQCSGNLDDAALWLTQHAIPKDQFSNFLGFSTSEDSTDGGRTFGVLPNESVLTFQRLELKTDCLNVCIIDDCQDSDVPLLELSMANLFFEKNLRNQSGQARCSFSVDYYNRFLSGWEPFLEPLSCNLNWSRSSSNDLSPRRLVLNLSARDVMNVNITRTLIDLYQNVKEVWTQDYYNPKDRIEMDGGRQATSAGYRRRSPFVPFALRNDTGCLLSISTSVAAGHCALVSSPESSQSYTLEEDSVWRTVCSGETMQFSFEERVEKHRHRDTHMVKHHQITVKVHGWKPVKPVSVDRVGVYFRHALPDNCTLDTCDLPQARIVFDVTLEGSARKLITVRSALLLHNLLELPVEVKLENTPTANSREALMYTLIIQPGKCEPVPLSYTHAQISLRPVITMKSSQVYYAFSDPVFWQRAQQPGDLIEETRQCHSNKGSSYRFCAVIRRENYPFDRMLAPAYSAGGIWTHPGHLITFISPMIIINLLPYDLHFIANDVESGIIHPGQQISLHEVSNEIVTEIIFFLESYPGNGNILISSPPSAFTAKLKLHDQSGRTLYLNVAVSVHRGAEIKVTVYSPYWIVNKTALPLVFRQEGVPVVTAGQFEEHEIARMVAPLMFSLTDPEASPTVVARLGARIHPEGSSQWCQHFHLHLGVQVRRLRVTFRDNRPDIVYVIGINVRPGRGRYRNTFIVTLSAHYQIHNKSSHTLQFAQKCFASTVSDPGAQATYLQALPNCNLPFHWPRLDKDQLLCLRILGVPGCLWSGGFRVTNDAFHINIRDHEGRMHFLRVEVVLQDATYFIIFTDAETMPPPLRIDNFSQVNLHFHQMLSDKYCMVRAHSSIPYAWDEPTLSHTLTIIAPGGVSANYNVNQLGKASDLTYENFIYIAFAATFNNVSDNGTEFDILDVQQQQLVLDVLPNSDRVVLNRKEIGARSQFWRMTSSGQLQHEGSSPPIDPRINYSSRGENVLVLDIAGPALQPKEYVNLALRRPSQRRMSTQTWRFTEDGRLCCAHNNMCVQARDGFFGLRKGSDAVLGPIASASLQVTNSGVPFEQAICRQKLRPGSGFLSVNVTTDGPTRVIEITDIQDKKTCALVKDCDWVYVDKIERPAILSKDIVRPTVSREFEIKVDLTFGVGLSLISRKPPEELIFARMSEIRMNYLRTYNKECVDVTVKDVQVDNQLFEAQCDVLLYVMPSTRNTEPEEVHRPALQMSCERVINNLNVSSRAEIIKSLMVRIKNLCLIVEERLLLKLLSFVGFSTVDQEQENVEENDFEMQQILAEVASVHAKRYYFEILELILGQVRLSVLTSNKLPPALRNIKKKLRLTLLKFEDATVDLKSFMRLHFFETSRYLIHTITKHFRDELKWQAAVILGSVDFLGNPLGLMNDVSEGVSGLLYEGNIGALVQNVTHGLSNSAAKMTETLSDGLGLITMDEQHEETRRRIRRSKATSGGDHLVAGLKGLGFGLLGGFTSVFKQTYEGAANEGVQGFVTGFGKGLVGTVTKPVVGMLDLASETATAVRDSSRSKIIPNRLRKPRCVMGPSGLLPLYSSKQSLGQELLYSINRHNYSELFIAYEVLRSSVDHLQIIVSSEKVRVFTRGNSVVLETHLRDVFSCQPLIQDTGRECRVYIELFVRTDTPTFGFMESMKASQPRIRCDNESIAAWVSEQVNYAKNTYIERQHTLVACTDHANED